MKRITETELTAIKLAVTIAKSAQSDLINDRTKVRALTLKHTIERLGSIQSLLQNVVLS